MSKNNKVVKYKVVNTNIDKKFIGKDLDLQKVRAKGGPTTKSKSKAPVWFAEFEKRNNQRLDKLENNVSSLRSDVNTLKTNLNRVIKLNNLRK